MAPLRFPRNAGQRHMLSASVELESRTARIFTFKLDLFANPPESLVYLIVLADRTFDFTVPVSVPRGIRGFRYLSGVAIFSNDAFDGQGAILVEQNAVRYDGVEGSAIIDSSPGNLNGEIASPFRLQASLENVQEFRVDSNSYPAEYGTGTGGQVNVVTKSGGNHFHGSRRYQRLAWFVV